MEELENKKKWGGKREGSGRIKGSKGINKRLQRLQNNPDDLTEVEVRERFRIWNDKNNIYKVVLSQDEYPDFILERNGKKLYVEVESTSSHFLKHKHNIEECDFIICWKHDWIDCPLPVIELRIIWKN